MALNSAVTADGAEIGRAQAMQAAAAGVQPEAAMNPVLLKPTGERGSQVIVMGRAVGEVDAVDYEERKTALAGIVADALTDLRGRYDVVICEGAGSAAEINLRAGDLANMGLARAADLPTLVVGDIDRGGVFASLFGTLALLGPADQALVAGFVINKFRGDPTVLAPGLDQLRTLTGRPTLGVLPWRAGLHLDAEDSLALDAPLPAPRPPVGRDGLDVAVVRLPRVSNFTDVDALACEPGVRVAFVDRPGQVTDADLVVVPGTKATVADLRWVRAHGIDAALRARARRGGPILGVCGGYQMLGTTVSDQVESGAGRVLGVDLLPVTTAFSTDKVLARRRGTSPVFDGAPAAGYEIRHGRVDVMSGRPLLMTDDGAPEGCVVDAVIGTSWHGLLESDELRRALLRWVAERTGRDFTPGDMAFADVREVRLDVLGDLVGDHLDTVAIEQLLAAGAPPDLAVIPPAGAPTT
jgi:adenosylcobyric acid synthase